LTSATEMVSWYHFHIYIIIPLLFWRDEWLKRKDVWLS
jgi:hypothetical protein